MRRIFIASLLPFLMSFFLQAQEPAGEAATITLTTVTGKKLHIHGTENGLDIQEYRGKIVFLEFWGTQCPPCLMSIPHYIELTKKYKGKLAVLAVEVQSTIPKAALKNFVERHKINYDVVDYHTGQALVQYISQRTQWHGSIPFLVIFGPDGNYVTSQVGMLPQEALEGVIKKLAKMEQKGKGSKGEAKNQPSGSALSK